MNQNEKVSLGCGTLIVIVLIVIIFGNMGSQNLEPQIRSLETSTQELERRIGDLAVRSCGAPVL